jgi:Zn-dependent protease
MIPKSRWISVWIPFYTEILLRYIFSLNVALGVFNMIPAFQLDGSSAWNALATILGIPMATKPWILLNSVALVILIGFGIGSLFFQYFYTDY